MAQAAAEVIARSLEELAEVAGDPAPQVYERLFAEIPDARERFMRDVNGSIRGEMLAKVFECLMHVEGPYQANLVKSERMSHDGFGTPQQEFDRFFGVVKEACRDLLGEGWTPEYEAAWSEQIARVLAASK